MRTKRHLTTWLELAKRSQLGGRDEIRTEGASIGSAARLRHRLRLTPPGPPFARGGKVGGGRSLRLRAAGLKMTAFAGRIGRGGMPALGTDEFFFLLATGSPFLQIILVGAMGALAGAARERRRSNATIKNSRSKLASSTQGGASETQGVALETQGVAVGLCCCGLSGREAECIENGLEVRSIYTGVRIPAIQNPRATTHPETGTLERGRCSLCLETGRRGGSQGGGRGSGVRVRVRAGIKMTTDVRLAHWSGGRRGSERCKGRW